MRLRFFDLLAYFGQKFASIPTYENIIRSFKQFKEQLLAKHPIESKLIYAQVLFEYYNLLPNKQKISSVEYLFEAKFLLIELYTDHIENRARIIDFKLGYCLELLSGCLAQLSRFFEPLYYINIAKHYSSQQTNFHYITALTLEAVQKSTCTNFQGLLLLKIVDSCVSAKRNPLLPMEQKQAMDQIELSTRSLIKRFKLKLPKLRAHKKIILAGTNKYIDYEKFCLDKQLYLSEHSFYCNCKMSLRDDIKIKSSHLHTQIEWVINFDAIVNLLVYNFILARKNFYDSLKRTKISHYNVQKINRPSAKENLKITLLKEAFRQCYSILDKIAIGVLEAMSIDYSVKKSYYFYSIWKPTLISEELYAQNFYLTSLRSISMDLEDQPFSAFKEFRKIRNAIEHDFLLVNDDQDQPKQLSKRTIVISESVLRERTELLLILTKSAIFSFVYLIRKQSIGLHNIKED